MADLDILESRMEDLETRMALCEDVSSCKKCIATKRELKAWQKDVKAKTDAYLTLGKELASKDKIIKAWEETLFYVVHEEACVLARLEGGEPTKNGGYRHRYAGKWYQKEPIDKTPKCTCGLHEALNKIKELR